MLRTEVQVETVKLLTARNTADGSPAELPVYVARPAGAGGERRPAILLIQEIFGVNGHIQDVAQRLASAGFVVAAPDMLYRSGHWLTFGYDQVAEAASHFRGLNEELVTGDMAAALDFLATQPDVDPERLGSIGFCFGGRASLVAAIRFGERIKAAALFYGGGIVSDQPAAPIHRVAAVKCPLMAFFGGLDRHIPSEHVRVLEKALSEAGVKNTVHLYPYADHGFFCDARPSYHPRAAQDAWHRTLRFFYDNLGPVPAVTWN